MNPYRITDRAGSHWPDKFTINFSGGRSSGYMLWHILEAYDFKLPDNIKTIFCNTGKERPETLKFVARFAWHYGVEIHWLEYRYRREETPRHQSVRTHFMTCSRAGEPVSYTHLRAHRDS